MKKHISKLLRRRLAFYFLMLSALAMITVSCEKEETVVPEEPETTGMTITEILESYGEVEDEIDDSSMLKWGRRDRPTFRTLTTALVIIYYLLS